MEEVLLGKDRLRTLTELHAIWEDVQHGGGYRVVVLSGPSGSGRTLLLRSLYRVCAMRQPAPRYWPDDVTEKQADLGDGPAPMDPAVAEALRRELIYPRTGTPAEGAELPWFWWGLRGEHAGSEAGPRFAALDADAQLQAHVEQVAQALVAADHIPRERIRLALNAAYLLASLVPLADTLERLIQFTDQFKQARDLWLSRGASGSRESMVQQARRANAGGTFTADSAARAAAAAESDGRLLGLVASVLPFLVVLDDADLVDGVTVGLMKALVRTENARVLVVVVVNPEVQLPDLAAPADRALIGNRALQDWLHEERRRERSVTFDVDPLPPEELARLAVHRLTAAESVGEALAEEALARVVAAAQGRPGVLIDLLGVPAVQRAVGSDGELPPVLPGLRLDESLALAYDRLPVATRETLSMLALHGPVTLRPWLEQAPPRQDTQRAFTLEQARAHGWVRLSTDGDTPLVAFSTPSMYAVARARAQAVLLAPTVNEVLSDLEERISAARVDGTWERIPAEVAESLLSSLCEVKGAAIGPALMAELMRLRVASGRTAASEALLEAVAARLHEGLASAPLLLATAEALFDAGRWQQAEDLLHHEWDRQQTRHGVGAPATFPALHNLASFYAAAAQDLQGRPDAIPFLNRAISLYENLLEGRLMHRSRLPLERIVRTRLELADLYAERYTYPEAIEQTQLAVIDLTASPEFGPEHGDTLNARLALATWRWRNNELRAALDDFEQLARDMTRILGSKHPNVWNVRHTILRVRADSGEFATAISEGERLLSDTTLVLGPDEPEPLRIRESLARWRTRVGQSEQAVREGRDLLRDRLRILGADHPDTLRTRHNLASALSAIGQLDDAIAEYTQLVRDRSQIVGPDDLETLITRSMLARCRAQDGKLDAAIGEYAALLEDMTRVLGPDHVDTLIVRCTLTACRVNQAEPNPAIVEECELLVEDMSRVLGPDHPETLPPRNTLISARAELDRDLPRAIEEYEVLLREMTLILGPQHPDTLTVQQNLARCRAESNGQDGRPSR